MAAGLSDFYPVLPIFFVISLVLLILPVWGFIRGRNSAVLFYISWLFLGNAIYYVDMLVWRGSVVNFAPIYCDIISVLVVMLPIGISCSLLCINILVWKISQSTTLVVKHTKRRVITDGLICVGIPLTYAGLHILVQNKRFTIVEDVGCMPATDHGLPSLFIYYLPPSIICCCITSVFCVRSIINFYRTRYRTNSLVPEHASHAISFNRYLRLILLCITSFLLIAFFLVGVVVQNIQIGFSTTASWASSSWDFRHLEILSRVDLDTIPHRKSLVLLELLPLPILAFHFFLFFGIGEEAMRNYRSALSAPGEVFRSMRSRRSKEEQEEDGTPMPPISHPNPHAYAPEFRFKAPSPIPFSIPMPPALIMPPSFASRHDFLVVNDSRHYSSASNPSSAYLVPSPSAPSAHDGHSRRSSRSSLASVSVSAGHFPYPPPHFFHEHPYAPYAQQQQQPRPRDRDSARVNTGIRTSNIDIEAGLAAGPGLQTGSTASRFSVYSDGPGTPVRERRFTHAVFTWGRRPNHSI